MKKFLSVMAVVGLFMGAANAQKQPRMRLFFDQAGAGEMENRSKDLSFANPDIAVDPGDVSRFYLYTEYGNDDEAWGISLNIAIEGDGEFDKWLIYNNFAGDDRWDGQSEASGSGGQFIKNTKMIALIQPGATNNAKARADDGHFRADGDQFGTTLLGYIDVRRDSGTVEVWLEVGRSKIAPKRNGTDVDVFNLGFGDEPVENRRNRRSSMFDARMTPEPTSLALLALGGLAVIRRRR